MKTKNKYKGDQSKGKRAYIVAHYVKRHAGAMAECSIIIDTLGSQSKPSQNDTINKWVHMIGHSQYIGQGYKEKNIGKYI